MKRIIYSNPDGSVAVVIPAPDYGGTMAELAAAVVPNGAESAIVEHTDIPTDRTFRNEWELVDDVVVVPVGAPVGGPVGAVVTKKISVNIPKAQAKWKDKWREARKPLLEALDKESLLAIEDNKSNVEKKVIKDAKKALRDVTLTVLPDTVEGIKATWPAILGPKPT